MLFVLAASPSFPFATVLGILVGLAGLSTALLCLLALADGALQRGAIGFTCGVLLLTGGLWLVGFLG